MKSTRTYPISVAKAPKSVQAEDNTDVFPALWPHVSAGTGGLTSSRGVITVLVSYIHKTLCFILRAVCIAVPRTGRGFTQNLSFRYQDGTETHEFLSLSTLYLV